MGKTTCLLNLCDQMMAAGVRPLVFSYHQDIDERLRESANSLRFIDFDGLGFNPLEVIQRESRMAYLDVAGALRDIFAAIYPELGDIQAERIRGAIKESFVEMGWGNADAAAADLQEPAFSRFVEILRDEPKPDRGLPGWKSSKTTGSSPGASPSAACGRAISRPLFAFTRRKMTTSNERLRRWCFTGSTRTCSAEASKSGLRTP